MINAVIIPAMMTPPIQTSHCGRGQRNNNSLELEARKGWETARHLTSAFEGIVNHQWLCLILQKGRNPKLFRSHYAKAGKEYEDYYRAEGLELLWVIRGYLLLFAFFPLFCYVFRALLHLPEFLLSLSFTDSLRFF